VPVATACNGRSTLGLCSDFVGWGGFSAMAGPPW
jgi:hypothetical protein